MNRQETQKIYFSKEEQYAAKEIVADVIQNLNFKAVAEEVRTGKQNPVYALKTILNWVRSEQEKTIIKQMIYKIQMAV